MLHWNPKVSSLHPVNLYIVLASSVIAGVDLSDSPLQAAQPQAQSLELIETIVKQGIKDGKMPGAVVVIADHDKVLYRRAFGNRQVEPIAEPMTLDTIFDLASLTKPIATTTSIMKLIDEGKISPRANVAEYLPGFGQHGKDVITVEDLLLHVGGLIPDNSLNDYRNGVETSWKNICELKPLTKRGTRFTYTDVGFIVLGKLVEKVSGQTLDEFAKTNVFQPLEMRETSFNPSAELRKRAAPTEQRDGKWLKGEVHDPRAHLLRGVAGHAGLFSTADDLTRYGQQMLRLAMGNVRLPFGQATYSMMTRPRSVERDSKVIGTRTYGWDHRSPFSSNRGDQFSDSAFGHGGFTGTVMWIDPEKDRVFIFLSNRLHPDGNGSVNRLAGEIASIIGAGAKR
ncbi:MAG: beta-lactamase family protein [Pirellulales bacterium]|nr:beta-lactamase family protein [Pirellulales bacterium]